MYKNDKTCVTLKTQVLLFFMQKIAPPLAKCQFFSRV